jgi:hypothetical protein
MQPARALRGEEHRGVGDFRLGPQLAVPPIDRRSPSIYLPWLQFCFVQNTGDSARRHSAEEGDRISSSGSSLSNIAK